MKSKFLSTPSARRATLHEMTPVSFRMIFLSTPSARRATTESKQYLIDKLFLSTPSARRATAIYQSLRQNQLISIHALREEGDLFTRHPSARQHDFYPRPPRGGRHVFRVTVPAASKFLSTPSARRATAKTETKSLFSNKLYNILHEFRRALIYNGSKSYPNHAK